MRSNQALIAELKRIAADHGGELKPEDVVAEARIETSPLHDIFEWDDTEAAHQYRIWQARQLIRVTVTYLPNGEGKTPMRVFVSLTPDRSREGGGYRATADVLSNARMRAQLLGDALAEIDRFKAKYSALNELAEVFAALSRAERKIVQELGYLAEAG